MRILEKIISLSEQYSVPSGAVVKHFIITSFHSLRSKIFFRDYFPLKEFNDIPAMFKHSWMGVGGITKNPGSCFGCQERLTTLVLWAGHYVISNQSYQYTLLCISLIVQQ